jgi:hypothetical protein
VNRFEPPGFLWWEFKKESNKKQNMSTSVNATAAPMKSQSIATAPEQLRQEQNNTGVTSDRKKLYCVLIPTHSNPTGGWLGLKWRRKFSRRHDEIILANVVFLHGGYTLIPPCEGGWMHSLGRLQVEGMRPFLFTAETQEEANIIADLVCSLYGQDEVMTFVWGWEVQFRKRREEIEFFANMLRPKHPSFFIGIRGQLARWMRWALISPRKQKPSTCSSTQQ